MPPSERGWALIKIVSVLVSLATISVALRVLARLKRKVKLDIDDYLCFVALLLLYSMFIELVLWCVIGGMGKHIQDMSTQELLYFGEIFLSNQFSYFLLSPIIKISIICFYRRIFSTRIFCKVTFAVNCLIAAWGMGIFLSSCLQCRPIRGFWDPGVNGHCFDGNVFFIVNQSFNVFMDFVILSLPLPMIWGLHRAWQDKLALTAVFALGGFICFASIYRVVALSFIENQDKTYTIYQATLWTHVEPSIGVVCSCLPIIRGLFVAQTLGRVKQGSQNRRYASPTNARSSLYLGEHILQNPDYIKMADTVAYRVSPDQEMGTINQEQHDREHNKIFVRTDINVTSISDTSE